MWADIPKLLKASKPRPGQFGLVRYGREKTWDILSPAFMEWYQCLDSFHYEFSKQHQSDYCFYYCCTKDSYGRAYHFLRRVEKELKLWSYTKFSFHMKGIYSVQPSPFWLRQPMRFSLFTLLLKASENFNGDWKKCMLAYPYLETTKDAVARFFSGHTVYKGRKKDWRIQFDSASCPQTLSLLRKPWPKKIASWFLKN